MIHLLNISLHDLFCALIKEGEGFEQFKDWNVVWRYRPPSVTFSFFFLRILFLLLSLFYRYSFQVIGRDGKKNFKSVPHDPTDSLSTINSRERERSSAAGGHWCWSFPRSYMKMAISNYIYAELGTTYRNINSNNGGAPPHWLLLHFSLFFFWFLNFSSRSAWIPLSLRRVLCELSSLFSSISFRSLNNAELNLTTTRCDSTYLKLFIVRFRSLSPLLWLQHDIA